MPERTIEEILATGAAWVTEEELERICKELIRARTTIARLNQQTYRDDMGH